MSSAPLPSPSPPGRPFLLPRQPAGEPSRSPLALWHLLSLDAPSVAAVWTAFIPWCAGVRISRLDPVAMFLAVWALYAADRLLDAKPLFTTPAVAHLEERHRFHHRHRDRFVPGILLTCVPLVVLLHKTAEPVLHLYILLAIVLGAWLLLIHARSVPSTAQHRLPKEIAVGLFFPAAVFIPTVARAPGLRFDLLPSALCFACVCTLNCLFLYAWEHPNDVAIAHPSTRWAVQRLRILALTGTLLTVAYCFFIAFRPTRSGLPHAVAAPLASALASGLLLALHAGRHRLRPTTLRALADLCLLTPLPLAAALVLHAG